MRIFISSVVFGFSGERERSRREEERLWRDEKERSWREEDGIFLELPL